MTFDELLPTYNDVQFAAFIQGLAAAEGYDVVPDAAVAKMIAEERAVWAAEAEVAK